MQERTHLRVVPSPVDTSDKDMSTSDKDMSTSEADMSDVYMAADDVDMAETPTSSDMVKRYLCVALITFLIELTIFAIIGLVMASQ
jgi:hypothetical protein